MGGEFTWKYIIVNVKDFELIIGSFISSEVISILNLTLKNQN